MKWLGLQTWFLDLQFICIMNLSLTKDKNTVLGARGYPYTSLCTLLLLDYSLQPPFTFSSSLLFQWLLISSTQTDECGGGVGVGVWGGRAEQSQVDGCEFKVSWSLAEVMEGYLWLYIWALAALPWWWRIKQHSCLFPEWCSAVLPDTTASL